MRIISGKYRGKKITPPKNLRARPTTDFAKEGLFNLLAHSIPLEELEVLDLFAGSGNIGFEFLSRGAQSVWSVDMELKAIQFIKRFVDQNDLSNIKAIRAEVYAFMRKCDRQFDLVYADPPYGHKHVGKLHEKIKAAGLVKPGGQLIIEHGPETDYSGIPEVTQQRSYGSVNFTFFKFHS